MPPLTTWICDACGDDVTEPQLALLIWRTDREADGAWRAYDFKIVHKNLDGRQCDPGAGSGYRSNLELDNYLGPDGVAWLLSMLSKGPLLGGGGCEIQPQDMDDFVDLFRRLQVPHYEEARRNFDTEHTREWLSDANEVLPYIPDTLERIANQTLGQ
jgi:hypothetical protein